MPRDSFSWDIKDLEERDFNDIFLPKDITEDLKLYTNIYDKTGKILRYLMVGNPGTAKTESGIVLSNELNKKGVTVIKTPICKHIHRKVELANVLAPSLIIFDDIDLSLGSRNSGGYSQLLGDFLDILDGTDKLDENVGIIATTNAAHLLDLAAQRPGRFDKTLLFDNITKGNIRNIILKSLSRNFDIGGVKNKAVQLYTANEIVNKFHEAGVSGSHIYNAIKMLKLRYDTLEMSDTLTIAQIIESIEQEIKVIDKIRNTSYLKDKYDRSGNQIGFGNVELLEEDEYDFDDEPEYKNPPNELR
jgi:SpoVK/Ycf46/Vps4 family AAA+-type ATPase